MNNSPINSTTVVELADASSLKALWYKFYIGAFTFILCFTMQIENHQNAFSATEVISQVV